MSEFRTVTGEEQQLLHAVSQSGLMEFNKNIAKDVRLSGSEEELRAFQYAQKQLDDMGFLTQLLFHEAYISLPKQASLSVMGESYQCITHSMGGSVHQLTGEVTYRPRGAIGNFTDVADRVILMDGLPTPHIVKLLTEQKAAAIIFIHDCYTHEMIVSPVWGHPVPETVHLLPKLPVVSVTKADGDRIKQAVSHSTVRCTMSSVVESGFRSVPTLTAELKGTDDSEDFVLFGGHIDSWHYGAMDNGSADALILEVARVLATTKRQLKRTLRVAFWSGHSHGRYAGSAWYCDTHWEDLEENCVVYVTVDSVGGKGSTILTQASCMAETRRIAWDAVGAITGQYFEGERFGRAGDQSFWGTGTPSLFSDLSLQPPFSEDPTAATFNELLGGAKNGSFGWWWHTTEDTLDKIDPELLVRDTKVYLLAIYRLLTDAVIPLDQYEAACDIEQGLLAWQKKSAERFDLSGAIVRTSLLKEKLLELNRRSQDPAVVRDSSKRKTVNCAILALSRILVPVNYVKGSRFDHDLALNQPPLPKLAVIDQLIAEEPGSDEYRLYYTSLQRKYNEVSYALKSAIDRCEQTLRSLS